MNYQHIYHAGNFADVIKHSVLIALIQRLQMKDKPLTILDVHAGAGVYDLHSAKAQKSREYQHGISRVMSVSKSLPEPLACLKRQVGQMNEPQTLQYYPGSPSLAATLLRPKDRLILVEKNPVVYEQLKRHMEDDIRLSIHQRDAYEALKALLPPMPRRGLVLIDPPFEEQQELDQLNTSLRQALKRWPEGVFVIWYPIKATSELNLFYRDMRELPCDEVIRIEMRILPDSVLGLMGCGLMIVNPPFQFMEEIKPLVAALSKILNQRIEASFVCDIIKKLRIQDKK